MKKVLLLMCFVPMIVFSVKAQQHFIRKTYHDAAREHLKEIYQVKDTISNILDGSYVSYYLNGNVESKGQFENNETTGVWEFYYETGNLKMRGILLKNSNYGKWEYYYENGQKAMEGIVDGKNREGVWKIYYESGQIKEEGEYEKNLRSGLWQTFFEDGAQRGEIEYKDNYGRYTEYYHSGKVNGEGPKSGPQKVGHWRYYAEDGSTLKEEGDYTNDMRTGTWKTYYPSGKVASTGNYLNDQPDGAWQYFYEDGKVSATGAFVDGAKSGDWQEYNEDGSLKGEGSFDRGSGEYREYYPGGALKEKGNLLNGQREGKWEYYYENGKLQGECDFTDNQGLYKGYFENGALQTKGQLEGDKKIGRWEIYETDGTLSGYYRPFYNNNQLGKEIQDMVSTRKPTTTTAKHSSGFYYFTAHNNEFRGLILEGNPLLVFAGRFPFGMEFYFQERLGHEFEFNGIRDPFFEADDKIPAGKNFERGYGIALKEKFYNPVKAGMWYFGQEIRFTNEGHFINEPIPALPDQFMTASAYEQRIEYGWLLGYRIMQQNNKQGFTIDIFSSADVGYRTMDIDPSFSTFFQDLDRGHLSHGFHFGLNLGNVFSYR